MNFLTDNKRLLNDTDDLTPDSIQFLREQIADETLCKAAPDLLEALIESRLYVEMAAKNCYNPVADNLLRKIDGLIAKARGK